MQQRRIKTLQCLSIRRSGYWRALVLTTCLLVAIVSRAAQPLVWVGAYGPAWDISITTNWFDTALGTIATFSQGDTVSFDDTAVSGAVALAESLSPASITVSNASLPYVFGGVGGITGATGLLKYGAGTLTLNTTNGLTGATSIQGGQVILSNTSALLNSTVTVSTNGGLAFAVNEVTLGNLAGSGSVGLTNGPAAVSLTLGGNNSSTTFSGKFTGTGSVTKRGAGVLTLSGTNAFDGTMTVSNGTVVVNGSVASSAVHVRGGSLAGTGRIAAPVSLETGGFLYPGAFNVGKIIIGNTLSLGTGSTVVMQLDKNNTNNDMVLGVSTLTFGGTLIVQNTGGAVLAAGDFFKLFDAASYAGSFAVTNLPALPTGLQWSLLDLPVNGIIRVVPPCSVAAVFSDNMVLQRGMPVPVWGTAAPGQTVSVTFAGQTKSATAGSDRKWLVRLDPMLADATSRSLSIQGPTNVVFTNVVVGDVWLASGQSNMQNGVNSATNATAEIAAANYPLLRHMMVQTYGAMTPVWDASLKWSWKACSPANASSLSAAAYFFGRDLLLATNVPIGLLVSCFGGTPAEVWTSLDALHAVPELQTMADEQIAQYYQGTLDIKLTASSLFNTMIQPLIPFALRGVIWYQGEGNSSRGMQYRVLFPTLIKDWRDRWQQGGFPFYYVQLPNFNDSAWSYLREAQMLTLQTTTNAGMAVTIEVGDPTNIHPQDKQDVGQRLADLALGRDYGLNVVPSGPIYRSFAVETNQLRLYFDYAEGGLMTGRKIGLNPVQELVGVAPWWFEVAGADQHFVAATAQIQGSTVVVASPAVPNPVTARYAWAANPAGTNLYNRAGLPASPFRIPVWTNPPPRPAIKAGLGNIQLQCAVTSNVTWWVQFKNDLAQSSWTPLTLPRTGTGMTEALTNSISLPPHRFYYWQQIP